MLSLGVCRRTWIADAHTLPTGLAGVMTIDKRLPTPTWGLSDAAGAHSGDAEQHGARVLLACPPP